VECPLSDTFPDPDAPSGQSDVDLLPGIHHLDGKHALWYVRSRYRSSDFDRNRRQQQMLRALYHQVLSLDVIPKIPQVWSALKETVSTDLGLGEILYLANIASRLDMLHVKSRFLAPPTVAPTYTAGGAYVLVPDREALRNLLGEALSPPATGRAQQRAHKVEVLNASGWAEMGYVAAERLRWENYQVTGVALANEVVPRTQIFDYTTTDKGSPLHHLMRLYQRNASDVVSDPSERSPIDFLVILGADYNPCIAPWITQ
jgi:hypothetical protein